ncbi:MAG: type VI secretion system ATPase TssH [Acidobacteria bacterium]|nr:type VI secretion system ATPase TssH [Acidobacteriota bacterium]
MDAQNIKALISRLNGAMTKSMEAAAGTCIQRSHHEISIEHLLLKLLDNPRSDIHLTFTNLGIQADGVRADLESSLAALKDGNFSKPRFSAALLEFLSLAWNFGSLERSETKVRSGHLLVAMLRDKVWVSGSGIAAFGAINESDLVDRFDELTDGSEEVAARKVTPSASGGILDEFTTDLVAEARAGNVDPVIGRDHEIHQVIDILTRRRKNNPILVGEPGVGKSAIVEGLALQICEGNVPPVLEKVEIRNLDMGQLKAGASMKGEFEDRLKNVIEAVQSSPVPVILFIDEAHTLIGAGGAAGSGDAANLLKPALARGQLRTIAATTWSEYKKYIEKDPALERRFQVVKVDEPEVGKATAMLRGVKSKYEKHHNVKILDSAIEAAASLADKYISGRQLPDKAIDLLDTSCARVRLSLNSMPFELTSLENRIRQMEHEIADKQHETELTGVIHKGMKELEEALENARTESASIRAKWESERDLVGKIVELELQINEGAEGREALAKQLSELQAQAAELAGEQQLVEYRVTPRTISTIVSQWTGIPVGKMVKNDLADILRIEDKLKERVLGQDHAAERIARAIKASKAKVNNPDTPIGVFLAVGPSGTGKTEMALTLADSLFGGERFVVQINMSEYQEKHTVSRMIGSPPGYVGYGEGGVLSEAVRQRPYTVVLLDEVEKGHPDVMNLFYQVFDKGHLADGEGRIIDFKNTIIMMTSNLGSSIIEDMCTGDEWPDAGELLEAIRPTLNQFLKPALLARMTVLPYFPIAEKVMKKIVGLKLRKVVKRLKQNHGINTLVEPSVIQSISDRCRLVEAGARNIDHIINAELLPLIANQVLSQLMEEALGEQLTIGWDDGSFQLNFS